MVFKKIRLSFVLSVLAASAAFGKEVKYKDYPLDLREGDRLVFFLSKGSLKLSSPATAKAAVFKVRKTVSDKAPNEDQARFTLMSFNVRREGSTVFVELKGPDSKSAWSQWAKSSTAPELHFEIEAPSVPVEILSQHAQVTLASWRQSAVVSLVSGAIQTRATDGLLRLRLQHGQIGIEKHRGRVEIDGYGIKVSAHEIEGDLDLTNFSGESNLATLKGNVDVKTHTGQINMQKSSGAVDFLNGRGSVTLNGFEGPVRGQTDQGAVSVTVDGEAEVRIDSNQGPVTVKLPEDSGAMVRMQSEEGAVSAPEAIRSGTASHARLVSGRLPGTGPKGTVAVKSKAGALRVRL